jgi:RHS repeat-associated protein
MIERRNDNNDGTPKKLVRYQFNNHLGSACLETDDADDPREISYEEYHPYGTTSYQAVDKDIKAAAKRYRYTGKERDEETGFSYHGARYYAPWLGRWTSCDPAGMVDGVNIYSFVKNNPIIFVDKQGFQSDSDIDLSRVGNKINPDNVVTLSDGGYDFQGGEGYVIGERTQGKTKKSSYHKAEQQKKENVGKLVLPKLHGLTVTLFGSELESLGKERAVYSSSAKEMSQTAKKVAQLGLETEESAARSAHGFRRAIKRAAREKTPAAIENLMKNRNISKSQDPLGKSYDRMAQTKTPMQIIESAGKTNKIINALGKVARVGGKALEVGGKALSVTGSAASGYKVGTGLNQIAEGKKALGAVNVGEGTANLGLSIGTALAVKSGAVVAEAGIAAAGVALLAGAAAATSIVIAAETARAAVKGEETPIDIADKFYGTHFGDIYGWVTGAYSRE